MSIEKLLRNSDFIKFLSVPNDIKQLPYGTTGYRMRYDILDGISIRMGIVAALRSLCTNKTVGLMITASHNPECDNGIKLIDPNGDMLPREWEVIAMEVVQWNEDQFSDKLLSKCHQLGVNFMGHYRGKVFIGSDTRGSSKHLSDLVKLALSVVGCESLFFEFVTTPQLHFCVKFSNDNGVQDGSQLLNIYFERPSKAFCGHKNKKVPITTLNVDCANGVGSQHLRTLSALVSDHLAIVMHNTLTDNLNMKCGADYVKINQCVPTIHNGDKDKLAPCNRWCTIDGDADRLLYFYTSMTKGFQLLDGDRIAVLFAGLLSEILGHELQCGRFTIAIIQTAYANSASTQYIENVLQIATQCVPTGVKNLHQAAKEFDIGIYFEANGHGTILFSLKVREYAESLSENHELRRLISLVNDADGDAIYDILVIEHILYMRQWSLEQWSSLYDDYPSRQLKVEIGDRNAIITMDAERKVKSPSALQDAIDNAVEMQLKSGVTHARAFVRPSGTEDIVRVYCESTSQATADELAETIAAIIRDTL